MFEDTATEATRKKFFETNPASDNPMERRTPEPKWQRNVFLFPDVLQKL
jgi:hypothetical protein